MGVIQISGKSAVFMLIMSSYVIVLFVSIFFLLATSNDMKKQTV